MLTYPLTLYANVLLVDGKIVNWKTGKHKWTEENVFNYRQPLNLCYSLIDQPDRITVKSFKFTAKNSKQDDLFHSTISREFYMMFDLHEEYPKSMFKPF